MIFVLTVSVMADNICKTETFPFEPIIPLFSDSVNHKIFTFHFLQNSVKYSSFIGKYSLAKYHKYGTVDTYAAIVAAEAKKASVPVCLHLDHGSSFELAMQAMHAGYTSVMIDGSKLDFEANIAETKRVADVAKALDIPCEAELGKVGGKEDDLEAEADTNTDPQEAKEFVERTGVTSLAVAIGTAHGFYVGTPVLDKERLIEIREVVDIPLVLHGASGLSDEDVMDCVKRGICKVNFATELRAAYSKAVKELLAEKPDTIDPKAYGKTAIAAVKELVMARMKVCGCDGKAE